MNKMCTQIAEKTDLQYCDAVLLIIVRVVLFPSMLITLILHCCFALKLSQIGMCNNTESLGFLQNLLLSEKLINTS